MEPGQRIRVHAGALETGTLYRSDADSLVIVRSDGSASHLAWSSVARVEASRGGGSSQGALRGAVIGGAAGIALLSLYSLATCPGYGAGTCLAIGALAGTVVGVPSGLITGAVMGRERWATIYERQ
jgi:hypothetical protein